MKMRLLILTALVGVLVFGLTLAPTVSAQSATATVTANANLRAGPGTNFAKVGSASAGSAVTLTGCTAAGDWCKLTDGTWVFAELLDSVPAGLPELEDVAATTPAPTRTAGSLLPTATPGRAASAATPAPTVAASTSGPVASGNANLRAGPGTGFERVGSVRAGQTLVIVGKTKAGDWYQLDGGAWIAAFLVSGTVGDVAEVGAPATAGATTAASPAVATPSAPVTSGERTLFVEFINPAYNCHKRVVDFEGAPGVTEPLYVHRSFQVDMYITNNGSTPIEPHWHPTRWIITDGQSEMVNDLMWEWVHRDLGAYAQPTVYPGQSAGWTWVAMPVGRNEWVKAVEYEHNGQVYRQEFDLGRYGNAHGYRDCGEDGVQPYRPTPTPRP